MAETTKYEISIKGEGVSISREVTAIIGQQIIMLTLGQEAQLEKSFSEYTIKKGQLKRGDAQKQIGQTSIPPDISIREFLNLCHPKRMPDKITAMAEYITEHKKEQFFSRLDIIQCYKDAAEPVPGNLSRDIKWAVKCGWIAPNRGERDSYYVTADGKRAVENNFPKEMVRRTKIAPGNKKKSIKHKSSKQK